MKSLKIAFGILLCVTILATGASVVCAVIAGNTAESFRDYRSSVITALSSLHAQLNGSQQAFADALVYLDGARDTEVATEHATLPLPDGEGSTQKDTQTDAPPTHKPADTQSNTEAETQAPAVLYTVREVDGRIGIFDADGTLLRTLGVPVATLPKADREQLAVGITLSSERELGALIEDYSG